MKKILLTGVCAAFFGLGFSQGNVAFFNFNSTTDDATVATGSDQAAQGTASITTIGGVIQAYATGNPNDINTTDNSGYQTTNYPAQDTDPKTAGIEMTVNTTGFSALQFECWQRLSNTAANTWVLQYTADVTGASTGGTVVWTDATTYTLTPQPTGTGDTWHFRSFSFTGIPALNNNPNVGLRIVSDYDPTAGSYVAARSTSSYGGGTSRFDLIRITEEAPQVSIASASNFAVYDEAIGAIQVPVTVQNGNTSPSYVVFGLSVYSDATVGADFTWATDTLFIPAQTNGTLQFPLTLVDDAQAERAEKIILKFIAGENVQLAATQNYQIIYIKDNDYQAPTSTNELQMSLLSSFSNGAPGSTSAEIVAYDSTTFKLYIANSIGSKLDIVDFSNPAAPSLLQSVDVTTYGNINSVTVHNGIVAMAIENSNPQDNGFVVFLDENGTFISQVTVGAMPDMITFNKDYTKILTANEGEPNADYSIDPVGSVSIVSLAAGYANLTNADVTTIGFEAYNGQETSLLAQGIRIFSSSASVAQDLEPEYITISTDNTKAFVGLQENNALAVIDLATSSIDTIHALGYSDYASGNGLDASDQSGAVLITSAPVKGTYMPDALAFSTIGGQGYVFSANEGDSREFGSVVDAKRINSMSLDSTVFVDQHILKNNKLFGRLNGLTYSGDTDGDGDFDEIHVMGGRSFSIWNASTGALVFDSKDIIEQITSTHPDVAAFFNASNSAGSATLKNRSDDKGPEPEGVATAFINGSHYLFVSLERIGGVMTFNVNDPSNPVYVGYYNNRTINGSGPDLGAEGIIYISSAASPNGNALVLLANEVSSTVSVYQVNTCAELIGAELTSATSAFCAGDSTVLAVSPDAATSVVWMSNGEVLENETNDSLTVETSGVYSAMLTSTAFACSATSNELEIMVYALPTVEIEATEAALCIGEEVSLTATGAATYAWSSMVENGVSFEPTQTATYTVVGTDTNSCSDTTEITIVVNSLPVIEVEASETTICAGDSVVLTATGAESYAWNNDVENGVEFSPEQTETYTVTATDANGCESTSELEIIVIAVPSVNLGADVTVCEDETPVTLNAGTHSNYEWSTGATTATLEVTTSGTYSVEVENAAGCTASDAITVTVESCLGVETLTQVVTVYPNPASNELQVQLATSEQVTIRVYDMQGKHVLTQTANATSTLNLESWSNGSYILEVETTQGTVRTRFVKK